MNVDFGPIQIAERLVHSALHGFANVPSLPAVGVFARDRQSQFERHVEARSTRRFPIDLHAGKIVEGVSALIDQRDDPIQPALAGGDFQSCSGYQAERAYTGNIGEVELLKSSIIRNVQKYGPLTSFWRIFSRHVGW